MNHEKRLVRNAIHRAFLQISETAPTPYELEAATRAMRKASRQLGLPVIFKVRFYRGPTMDALSAESVYGTINSLVPRTIWVRAGLPWSEIQPTTRHEIAHIAQAVAGVPVGHDGLSTRDGSWRACTVERFAQGDKMARKTLRLGVRLALEAQLDSEGEPT